MMLLIELRSSFVCSTCISCAFQVEVQKGRDLLTARNVGRQRLISTTISMLDQGSQHGARRDRVVMTVLTNIEMNMILSQVHGKTR